MTKLLTLPYLKATVVCVYKDCVYMDRFQNFFYSHFLEIDILVKFERNWQKVR
jgi:hypothetical protein